MEILTGNHVMHFSKRVISQIIAKYVILPCREINNNINRIIPEPSQERTDIVQPRMVIDS